MQNLMNRNLTSALSTIQTALLFCFILLISNRMKQKLQTVDSERDREVYVFKMRKYEFNLGGRKDHDRTQLTGTHCGSLSSRSRIFLSSTQALAESSFTRTLSTRWPYCCSICSADCLMSCRSSSFSHCERKKDKRKKKKLLKATLNAAL